VEEFELSGSALDDGAFDDVVASVLGRLGDQP
jgi:hypothetical protein